jgi:hypothetical protein
MGGEQGRLKFPPPENHSPLSECLLPTQILAIDPCFYFGDLHKTVLAGPMLVEDDSAFVPTPVNTDAVSEEALNLKWSLIDTQRMECKFLFKLPAIHVDELRSVRTIGVFNRLCFQASLKR